MRGAGHSTAGICGCSTAETFPGIEREDLRLPEVQVDTWGGFIFVKLSPGGAPLREYLEPIPEQLAAYRLDEYVIQSWRTAVFACNWKVALEAFEESYHLLGTHPQVVAGVDDVGCTYETFGIHSRMLVPTGVASPRSGGKISEQDVLESAVTAMIDFELSDDQERAYLEALWDRPLEPGKTTRDVFLGMTQGRYGPFMPDVEAEQFLTDYHYTFFPNITFNLYPGSLVGIISRPNGGDPDSCIADIISFQHPCGEVRGRVKRQFIDDPQYDWGVVMSQDFNNLPRVQQGMHQRQEVRLASYQEQRIYNRHKVIQEYYENYRP
jgi:hypothetical protein